MAHIYFSGCNVSEDREDEVMKIHEGEPWREILPSTKLSAHKRLFLEGSEIKDIGVVSHVRLTIAPDGGISRLRLWGHIEDSDSDTAEELSNIKIEDGDK